MFFFKKKETLSERESEIIKVIESFIEAIRTKRQQNGYYNSPVLNLAYFVFFLSFMADTSMISPEEKERINVLYPKYLTQGTKAKQGDIVSVIGDFNHYLQYAKNNEEIKGHILSFYLLCVESYTREQLNISKANMEDCLDVTLDAYIDALDLIKLAITDDEQCENTAKKYFIVDTSTGEVVSETDHI